MLVLQTVILLFSAGLIAWLLVKAARIFSRMLGAQHLLVIGEQAAVALPLIGFAIVTGQPSGTVLAMLLCAISAMISALQPAPGKGMLLVPLVAAAFLVYGFYLTGFPLTYLPFSVSQPALVYAALFVLAALLLLCVTRHQAFSSFAAWCLMASAFVLVAGSIFLSQNNVFPAVSAGICLAVMFGAWLASPLFIQQMGAVFVWPACVLLLSSSLEMALYGAMIPALIGLLPLALLWLTLAKHRQPAR